MRVFSDNGGMQQNQLLIPSYHNQRETQHQPQIQSVYADVSANNSAEEFNGNFTSIDTEVVRHIIFGIFTP